MINPDEDNYMPIGGIHKINSKSFLSMSQKRCHGNSDLVLFTVFSTKFMCSFIYLCLFVYGCMYICVYSLYSSFIATILITSISSTSMRLCISLYLPISLPLHLCVFVFL